MGGRARESGDTTRQSDGTCSPLIAVSVQAPRQLQALAWLWHWRTSVECVRSMASFRYTLLPCFCRARCRCVLSPALTTARLCPAAQPRTLNLVELCQVRAVNGLIPEHAVDGEVAGRLEALLLDLQRGSRRARRFRRAAGPAAGPALPAQGRRCGERGLKPPSGSGRSGSAPSVPLLACARRYSMRLETAVVCVRSRFFSASAVFQA